MAASIFHRVTGIGLYLGMIGLIVWLALLASGPMTYAWLDNVFHSWFGQLKLYGLVAIVAFHSFNGVRHLFWDISTNIEPKRASRGAWLAFLFALAAPFALWGWLGTGAAP